MLPTYKVTLHGNQLEWNGEAPELLKKKSAVSALITILEEDVDETATKIRPFGLAAGEFAVPDDFDAPLPDEIVELFEGK
jgi:hypothetical protein